MTQQANNERNTFINYIVWLSAGTLDYINTCAIYIGYLTPALIQAFQQSLQYVFFPIYAVNTVISAVLALNNLLFDRDKVTNKIKNENILRLVVNSLSAVIVTIAVVGALAFSVTMGLASTFLFAANLAMTGIYNFSSAGYHLYHFVKKGNALKGDHLSAEDRERIIEERQAHRSSAISHAVVGATIALVALAGGLAVLGGFLPLAGIGIAAGVIGFAFCIYGLVTAVRKRAEEQRALTNTDKVENEGSHDISRSNSHLLVLRKTNNRDASKSVDKRDIKSISNESDFDENHAEVNSQTHRLEEERELLPDEVEVDSSSRFCN